MKCSYTFTNPKQLPNLSLCWSPSFSSSSSTNLNALYISRGAVWFFALVAFSIAASIDLNGFKSDSLNFIITIGVIVWLYQMVLCGNFLAATYANHEIAPIDMLEHKVARLGDLAMLFFVYTATICASDDSSKCSLDTEMCHKYHATAVFMWFSTFGVIANIYLRDPETFKALVKGKGAGHYDDIDDRHSTAGNQAPSQKTVDL